MNNKHMHLFSKLADLDRVSIRSKNPELAEWELLQEKGLVSIFEGGRTGTVIIHLTKKGEYAATNMKHIMEYTDGVKS